MLQFLRNMKYEVAINSLGGKKETKKTAEIEVTIMFKLIKPSLSLVLTLHCSLLKDKVPEICFSVTNMCIMHAHTCIHTHHVQSEVHGKCSIIMLD